MPTPTAPNQLRPAPPKNVLITGASSGIGEALARVYAAPGVSLALTGRDRTRLEAVAAACRDAGATVETATLDVSDRDAMGEWIAARDRAAPIDLLIANAGISAGTGRVGEDEQQVREILSINLDGVINSVMPMVERMRERGRGQLALMSSLASFRGFPGAPAYCASKAAVRVWGEALRGELARDGIAVTVICPGFVRSRMTAANPFRMPFLMDADAAAEVIRKGLAHNRARITFPWRLAAAIWALNACPPALTDAFLARLPKKG